MTYYEVLQVVPTASPEVIRMAYRALASKYHPDVFQGNKEYAEEKMKQLNEAYSVLSSTVSRQEYDRLLWQREQARQAYQAYQANQASQAQKQQPVQKKKGFSKLWVIALVLAIPLAGILLDASGFTSDSTSNSNHQTTVAGQTKAETSSSPAVIVPRSGDILSGSECFDGSELTITADSGSSYVVKLKTSSGVERLSFYVRAGDTVTVGVPAEYLYVYFASGDTWYGKKLLFGDKTYYSMDDDILDFRQYTWEYTLYPVNSGNFSETPIDPDEF